MRPQQQNRRMRGRGNNNNNNGNRRGPNPLTRSFESNGPDVKIRGTAQQIADKYTALARDAQSSGDRVIAENYLQHAEHYNRIIAAAQAQQQQQQAMRDSREDADEDGDEREDFDSAPEQGFRDNRNPGRVNDGSGPQPVIEGMPAEIALKDGEGGRGSGNGRHHHRNGSGTPEGGDHAGTDEAAATGAADGGSAKGEASPAEAAEGEIEAAPRKTRRPRRPRSAPTEDAGETDKEASPAPQ